MLRAIFSAFGFLGWIELIAAFVVATGCAGELWIVINKLTLHIEPIGKTAAGGWRLLAWIDKKTRPLLVRLKIRGRKLPEAKEQLLERAFVAMVALGVSVEFFALPFSMLEIAHLNTEASGARKESSKAIERAGLAERKAGEAKERAAGLEKEAAQTRERAAKLEVQVAGLNPLTRPVVSLSAFVQVGFSNSITTNAMVGKSVNGDELTRAELSFWSVRTHKRFGAGPPTVRLATDNLTSWDQGNVLMTLSRLDPFELLDWPRKETAGELLDKLDSVELHPWFVADEKKICRGGFVVLTINSVLTKRFEIPAQTTTFWSAPVFGTDTNTVTYDPNTTALRWR